MNRRLETLEVFTFHSCDVNWGSHGCRLNRGHDGQCECSCCFCPNGEHDPEYNEDGVYCVANTPYYGPDTRFYGDDVDARRLPSL